MQLDAVLDFFLDLGAHRTAGDGELDLDRDETVVGNRDGRDHAQRDDVGAEFGVDDRTKYVDHFGLGGRRPAGLARCSAVDDAAHGEILPVSAG